MKHLDDELLAFIARLHTAMPEPTLWNGMTARACQLELQKIVDDLHRLRVNLIELPWLG